MNVGLAPIITAITTCLQARRGLICHTAKAGQELIGRIGKSTPGSFLVPLFPFAFSRSRTGKMGSER